MYVWTPALHCTVNTCSNVLIHLKYNFIAEWLSSFQRVKATQKQVYAAIVNITHTYHESLESHEAMYTTNRHYKV
jgi:hypothetical protein